VPSATRPRFHNGAHYKHPCSACKVSFVSTAKKKASNGLIVANIAILFKESAD